MEAQNGLNNAGFVSLFSYTMYSMGVIYIRRYLH